MISKLASIRLFFWILGLIIAACVVGAVVPQGEEPERYGQMFGSTAAALIERFGADRIFSSAWFNSLLALLGLNLAACSVRRLGALRARPGVFVTHIAVLVILVGAFIRGVWGLHGILPMRVGETHGHFYVGGDQPRALPFEIRLNDFEIDYRSTGRHILRFMDHATEKQEAIEITGAGRYHLNPLAADVRVLALYPDFTIDENGPRSRSDRPVNPAVQVEIVKNGHASTRWLFARHPDFNHNPPAQGKPEMDCCAQLRGVYEYLPGDIRQFRSRLNVVDNGRVVAEKTIYVNEPLRYKGYTFYQASYDPNDPEFSSLQVAKDPSVPIVYAGFILLPVGLVWSFSKNPQSTIQNPNDRRPR